MLIVALVMAAIGLTALVTAIVSGNEVIAWLCIAASLLGVVVLIVDAVTERRRRDVAEAAATDADGDGSVDSDGPEATEAEPDASTEGGTAVGDDVAPVVDGGATAADEPVGEAADASEAPDASDDEPDRAETPPTPPATA